MLRYISKLKNHHLPLASISKPSDLLLKQISFKTEPFPENETISNSGLAQFGLNPCSNPNDRELVRLIRESTRNDWFSIGQQLHCRATASGLDSNVFVSTALINFYLKFELINEAHNLFDEMPHPNLVSWNSLISGYIRSGQCRKALNLFIQLETCDVSADSYSCTAALSACGQLSFLLLGRSIHSKIVKLGVASSVVVGNCLTDMYGKCGAVEDSVRVFEEMNEKDVISLNSVIAANARNGRLEQALNFLHQMSGPDTISYNEVISGIAQFGHIEDAIDILFKMPQPNSSSWNSVITGYVNRNRARDALEFFCKMQLAGVRMDQFTYSSILSGVASLSAIIWGMVVHCCTIKCGVDQSVVVGSALIDMYSKCGRITEAEICFHSLQNKNLITWNAMLSGYAHNGHFIKVIQLFEQLIKVQDLHPDGITFLNVLSACWHSRVPLEAANLYLKSMMNDYKIDATAEHCSCMIRIMGEEGKLNGAENMINELGFESCSAVWRALLSASVGCGNVEAAELAAEKVMKLEGDSEYVYVVMSNLYAGNEKWKDVRNIRALMKERNVRKEAGHSWIELENAYSN
ncbi:OLC1v1031806C1 [Oldenlandia corymbosa var. corymbosa]|uniref:OLC1v1031806C1 n=1 Tax=Oldenlandia corymbosa var. corymbosa TaxID=529605 RepID=A0AAV1CKB3_OLDCO|nr:OLC1v1031806C1 [Oldenlandia corymbosa var. corymbosa]